ncbi:MAG TPA: hypothetical protein ENN81_11265 [Phycisphaerales bacterium]|nr:hypothetical protein [Phycisphaerales bacterium]
MTRPASARRSRAPGGDNVETAETPRPPQSRADLRHYIQHTLGIAVPDRAVCPAHAAPLDYLWHSFHTDFARPPRVNGDAIVWANRAGGKTQLAAVATLLDCLFKPRCQVRILAGSARQAAHMYEHLTGFLEVFEDELRGRTLKDRCRFKNGSNVEMLTQSPVSVRGHHVQKLRCDEVELFSEEVFAAAQFTTQSRDGILAAQEIISTMHQPYGLMQKIVSRAEEPIRVDPRQSLSTPLFKWCVWETIEPCLGRTCSQCPLWTDCGGKAKNARGYLRIDDCITQMQRASRAGWEAEMLCRRPSLENVVFGEFDPDIHVRPVEYDANLPLYRAIDFGFVNPFVCLWIQVDADDRVRVIDEYLKRRVTIDVHAAEIKSRTACPANRVAGTYCDPAGRGANDITGTNAIDELRTLGIPARSCRSSILEGIEHIRRAIRAGDGTSRLVISPRCRRLIEALRCYHYPDHGEGAAGELPLKDGIHDHPIDALRYFFVNYKKHRPPTARPY